MGNCSTKERAVAEAATPARQAGPEVKAADAALAPEAGPIQSQADALEAAAQRMASVNALHAKFDIDGAGALSLALLSSVKIQLGPHLTPLFVRMDYDVDGYITKAEWQTYFSTAAAELSADEFNSVVEDFAAAADHFITVVKATSLAESVEQGAPLGPDEVCGQSQTRVSPQTPDRTTPPSGRRIPL